MKNLEFITGLLFCIFTISGCKHSTQDDSIPTAPNENRRPENFIPFNYKYSLEELKTNFSDEMMQMAKKRNETVTDVNNKGKWKPTPESLDRHQAPEWLLDAKFGMFIDWGLWSVAGWAPKKEEGAMYPDWYEFRIDTDPAFMAYHEKNWGKDFGRDDFIPLFMAKEYHPEYLVNIAKEAGMKYIIPFCKHHSGFCLWPSSFTQRDAGNMGPEKDLIKPLIERCREQDIKFGFYFSTEEWEYPLIGDNNEIYYHLWGKGATIKDIGKKCSGKIPVKNFAEDYIIPQSTEFIDKYDPDILWFDGEWETSVYDLRSYDIAAYFYNQAEGRKEVAVNDRYGLENGERLRFKRGDIFTSEFHDNDNKVKVHPWEANRGISQSFGYNWQDTEDNVITTEEFIEMFVDMVSHGGNLLLIVNLDGQGALPKVQETRLIDIGKWLKVNGEGIYGTRMYSTVSEGPIRYTRSKDNQKVYAITTGWPGKSLELTSVTPEKGSKIFLLGEDEPLKWSYDKEKKLTTIEIPDKLQEESKRPCKYAYTFKISVV